jgi:hypothetical protein
MPRRAFRRHTIRILIPLLEWVPVYWLGPFALAIGPGAPPTTNERIAYAAIALPFLLLGLRTMFIGVFTGPEGVKVRNVIRRTRRIPWRDVDAFVMGDRRGFPCGAVRLRDGTEITAFALNPPLELGTPDRRTPWLLSELNGELARARAAGLA